MAITCTTATGSLKQDMSGIPRRSNVLTIAGLTAGAANTIPHALPYTPRTMNLRPSALGLWGETSVPDATNLYITVGTNGATSGTIDVGE